MGSKLLERGLYRNSKLRKGGYIEDYTGEYSADYLTKY